MTFKKFIDSVDLENQNESLKNKPRRYGQILMQKLQEIWPDKYNRTIGTDKDPSLSFGKDDDKTIRGFLYNLEAAWPACPANLNKDQVRVQRLEKKIKKLQKRSKSQKEKLDFYQNLLVTFPSLQGYNELSKRNFEYAKKLSELQEQIKEKNWTIRGLRETLNVALMISDKDFEIFEDLPRLIGDSFVAARDSDGKAIEGKPIIEKAVCILRFFRNRIKDETK